MSGIAMRIGITCTVLGFGSLVLEQVGREFILLSWAHDMQPVFGIVLGVVGLALIGVAVLTGRAKAAPQPQQPVQGQPPQQPGQS